MLGGLGRQKWDGCSWYGGADDARGGGGVGTSSECPEDEADEVPAGAGDGEPVELVARALVNRGVI